MPEVPNKLTIKILGLHRRNQRVAALDAINSEQGAWIERHWIPWFALFRLHPIYNLGARKICDAERRMTHFAVSVGSCDKIIRVKWD